MCLLVSRSVGGSVWAAWLVLALRRHKGLVPGAPPLRVPRAEAVRENGPVFRGVPLVCAEVAVRSWLLDFSEHQQMEAR